MHIALVSLLVLHAALTQAAAVDSDLTYLLREFAELRGMDRDSQISKRVNEIMQLLTAPLEANLLQERAVDGTLCDDGIKTDCAASVTCDPVGSRRCIPGCDSPSHGGVAHFTCQCGPDHAGTLCDVARADAEASCDQCISQGAKNCFVSISSDVGYYCYDSDYKLMTVTQRGLEATAGVANAEELGLIGRVLNAYLNNNL